MAHPKTSGLVLLAGILSASILSGLLAGGPRPEGPLAGAAPPGRVAVIDLAKAVPAYREFQLAYRELDDAYHAAEPEFKAAEEEIKRLQQELMLYDETSGEYRSARDVIEQKQLALQQKQRSMVLERNLKLNRRLHEGYEAVEKAVQEYGLAHELDVVLSRSRPSDEDLKPDKPDDFLKWLSSMEVVWNGKDSDITDEIIEIINRP